MTEVLSSDILEDQFGPTKIDIIEQDERCRIIATLTQDGQILELSRVEFEPYGIAQFPLEHARVIAGGSIGKVFSASQPNFQRNLKAAFRYSLPANFARAFASPGPATVMDVLITVGPAHTPYTRITETYTPALERFMVLDLGQPDKQLLEKISLLNEALERHKP